MKWSDFKFFTDENIHPKIVFYFREQWFEVFDVKEQKLSGTSDQDLFELADFNKSIFITHDGDFGTISFQKDKFLRGIIYLRPAHINYQISINSLDLVFNSISELNNSFIIVAKNKGLNVKIRFRNVGK